MIKFNDNKAMPDIYLLIVLPTHLMVKKERFFQKKVLRIGVLSYSIDTTIRTLQYISAMPLKQTTS
jgi:hypothetical protein